MKTLKIKDKTLGSTLRMLYKVEDFAKSNLYIQINNWAYENNLSVF